MSNTLELKKMAAQLYDWGANVTVIRPVDDWKRPFHTWKELQTKRQDRVALGRLFNGPAPSGPSWIFPSPGN